MPVIRRRFRDQPSARHRRIEFPRLRDVRWNRHALWKYLILLILVLLLLKFLRSF